MNRKLYRYLVIIVMTLSLLITPFIGRPPGDPLSAQPVAAQSTGYFIPTANGNRFRTYGAPFDALLNPNSITVLTSENRVTTHFMNANTAVTLRPSAPAAATAHY